MTEDVELQAYLNEVSLNGTGPNGGLGRVNMTTTKNITKSKALTHKCHVLNDLHVRHCAGTSKLLSSKQVLKT